MGLYSSKMLKSGKIITEELLWIKGNRGDMVGNASCENGEDVIMPFNCSSEGEVVESVTEKILEEKMTENFPLLTKAISLRKSIPVRAKKKNPRYIVVKL